MGRYIEYETGKFSLGRRKKLGWNGYSMLVEKSGLG